MITNNESIVSLGGYSPILVKGELIVVRLRCGRVSVIHTYTTHHENYRFVGTHGACKEDGRFLSNGEHPYDVVEVIGLLSELVKACAANVEVDTKPRAWVDEPGEGVWVDDEGRRYYVREV